MENRRLPDQRVVQRHVLHLGELNGVQESSWRKTVELFGQDEAAPRPVALVPEEHAPASVGVEEFPIGRVPLAQMALRRPRQWGACWLGCQLWEQLGLGEFGRDKLHPRPRRPALGSSPANPRALSPDRSGFGVAAAPALV